MGLLRERSAHQETKSELAIGIASINSFRAQRCIEIRRGKARVCMPNDKQRDQLKELGAVLGKDALLEDFLQAVSEYVTTLFFAQ